MDDRSKRKMAILFYASGTGDNKEEIAKTLERVVRTVNTYLTDVDKQLREERKERIFEMWLACHTQEEIAAAVGVTERRQSQTDRRLCCKLEAIPIWNKVSEIT